MANEKFRKIKAVIAEKKTPILVFSGLAVAGALLCVGYKFLGGNNQNELEAYSPEWFKNLSDTALRTEREKARLAYRDAGGNFDLACKLQHLLGVFDTEIYHRNDTGPVDYVSPIHREHGTNLYKPD